MQCLRKDFLIKPSAFSPSAGCGELVGWAESLPAADSCNVVRHNLWGALGMDIVRVLR